MAIQKVIQIDVDELKALGGIDNLNKAMGTTEQSAKSLRTQLREAQLEVVKLSEKFGATSKEAVDAAKKAALLKDSIADAKTLTDAYNPDAKFNALGGALQGVAGGFSAVQGALGTLGVESESTEKMILKVNSAMALSSGLNALLESRESFKNLGKQAADAFKAIRAGIGSTGIGLLVVALGTIVVYWEDIKELVSGVSEEQSKLTELSENQYQLEQEKSKELGNQDNILKLQGKSEKEILQIKLKQYQNEIAAGEDNLKKIKNERDLRILAAKENFNALKNGLKIASNFALAGLRLMVKPVDILIATVNKVSDVLGYGKIIQNDLNGLITQGIEKMSDMAANFVFDPKGTADEFDKKVKNVSNTLNDAKNKAAGIQLQINELDKSKASSGEGASSRASGGRGMDVNKNPEVENTKKIEDEKNRIKEEARKRDFESLQKATKEKQEALEKELQAQQEAFNISFAISEEERKKNAEAEMLIDQTVKENKIQLLEATTNALMMASQIAGEQTGVGKALAVASTVISTYSAAQKAYESAFLPVPTYISPILGRINQGIAIASGIMNVKKILSVKTPTAGGGGSASITPSGGGASIPAPNFNIAGNTGVNQIASTLAGQQPVKAYVVAKEVTTQQELDRNKITATKI